MAWTTPRTWVTGEVVTAALLNAQIKGNMDLSAPAKLTTAGDMLYATGANATARLAKGTNGNILHQASCAPAWTATPSITSLTLSGALDANGSIDFDGTTVAACASGAITLTSTSSSACGIYLRANGGTSETVKIHADQGTGEGSITLTSDAGGIDLNAAAGKDIALDSGQVLVTATHNTACTIYLHANGGTSETIKIHADQGTSESSITILSDAGGINVDAPSGKDIDVSGGTINLTSIDNSASAIYLRANAGTSETIKIHADQGNGAASICLTSDAGGITLTPSSAVTVSGALTVGVNGTGHDVKFFGCESGAYVLYDESEETLEIRGAAADAATSTGKLLLSTALTNINACDVIGSINFQAPLEAGCCDAILVAAGIRAVAQATFTCAVNATDLIFYTGHSEAAAERFRFTSQNEIGVAGANYGTDGQVLTSGGACAAVAWEDAGGGGLNSCADAIINNGYGIVLGNCAQLSGATHPNNDTAEMQIIGTAGNDSQIAFIHHSTSAGAYGKIQFARSRNATVGSHTIVQDGDALGGFHWFGCDGNDYQNYGAKLVVKVDGTPGNNSMPGRMEFYTATEAACGNTLAMTINHDGIITQPKQPAFLAYNASTITNVTGNNTQYTGVFGTEVFDQNADFDGTSTFTAPVTGRYRLSLGVGIQQAGSASRGRLRIVTPNRTYESYWHPDNHEATTDGISYANLHVLADIDAAEAVTTTVLLNGTGADSADFAGSSELFTSFGGELVA